MKKIDRKKHKYDTKESHETTRKETKGRREKNQKIRKQVTKWQ